MESTSSPSNESESKSSTPPSWPSTPSFSETSGSPDSCDSTCNRQSTTPIDLESDYVQTTVFSASFNQDFSCFSCGTDQGFRIYNCDPFKEAFRKDFGNGGIGIVQTLFHSDIVAFVGGEENPEYPPTKVMIWSFEKNQCVHEFNFRHKIKAVKLRWHYFVVVLETQIYVYRRKDWELVHQIGTIVNPNGICAVSCSYKGLVLACHGLQQGQVRVEHFSLSQVKFISAHESDVASFALSWDGGLLATASTKGTIFRIFNTLDGKCLQQVYRGGDRAKIYSMALSQTAQWLAVSSDKGTVHVFNLKVQVAEKVPSNVNEKAKKQLTVACNESNVYTKANTGSSLSLVKGFLPKYLRSERSLAYFHLPKRTEFVIGFGHNNTIMAVGGDGRFYRLAFDPIEGGKMAQIECLEFLKFDNENNHQD